MSQTIEVTVKGFSVTQCIDPKSKTEVPTKFRPKAVAALKNVQVDPPKGKTLNPYSVDVTVAIKKVPKGVRAEVKVTFSDQDPYSKKDKYLGEASGGATVQATNPDKGDTEAAVEAALQEALKTVITGIKDNAKKP
jgi:hypothetical protein